VLRGRRHHGSTHRPRHLVGCRGVTTHRRDSSCGRGGAASPPDRTGALVADRRSIRAIGGAYSRDRNRRRRRCGSARRRRGRSRRRSGSRRCGRSAGRSRRRRRYDGWSERRSRGRCSRRRQEQQRIDIAVRILGAPDAEVDVWDVVLELSGRTDRADDRPLAHGLAAPNARRAEMRQGHRVPVGRVNRRDFAAHWHGSGERDGAGRRREDRLSGPSANVDSAVLARGVRIVAEDEFLEYRAFDGPGPRSRGRHDHEGRRERDDQGSTHLLSPCCPVCQQRHDTWASQPLSIWTTETCRKGACAAAR
jgi:hypothetical protein